MWPGEGGDVLLELQDRQEGFSPAPLDSKSGSRQNLAVLQFDAERIHVRRPQLLDL